MSHAKTFSPPQSNLPQSESEAIRPLAGPTPVAVGSLIPAEPALSPEEPSDAVDTDADAPIPDRRKSDGSSFGGADKRKNVVDQRTGLDRRVVEIGTPTGLERRRGPGRRRSDDRKSAEEGEMSDEQFEFIMAVDTYKRINKRPFPSWTEVLEIVKQLGYRKVSASTIHLPNDNGRAGAQ